MEDVITEKNFNLREMNALVSMAAGHTFPGARKNASIEIIVWDMKHLDTFISWYTLYIAEPVKGITCFQMKFKSKSDIVRKLLYWSILFRRFSDA